VGEELGGGVKGTGRRGGYHEDEKEEQVTAASHLSLRHSTICVRGLKKLGGEKDVPGTLKNLTCGLQA